MKIIVAGANGQLGREVVEKLNLSGFEVYPFGRDEMDVSDRSEVLNRLGYIKPELIVNCAAYTKVDEAEKKKELAYKINRDGAGFIAEACLQNNIFLIHISTDFVFDGLKNEPYKETDPVCPINIYGKSKAAGELEISRLLKEYVIIRTSWLFGYYGENFVKTMLKIGKNKPFINVVSDQTGSPTCASDLADAIYKIVHEIFFNNNSARGIYHYSGEGITSWFGFAEIIFQIASRYGKIVLPKVSPISASQYPSKTKRPKYSVLDCTKIKEDFGITTKYWETSLENVIQKIMRAKTNGLQPNRLIT